mmetsp:Transcript_20236/g.44007  ORF Transcript_20236/g.44007 Transcript_20236/m.44007 type:complete len:91 (-) Transcript_20236:245-517(-)
MELRSGSNPWPIIDAACQLQCSESLTGIYADYNGTYIIISQSRCQTVINTCEVERLPLLYFAPVLLNFALDCSATPKELTRSSTTVAAPR